VKELRLALAFYHRQEPGLRRLRLLQSSALDEQEKLEQELQVTAEIITPEPYGSLVLKGLAVKEAMR
jgi:hypothetical protein